MKANQNLPQKLFNQYMDRFKTYSDQEIIRVFNSEIGNRGWGTARASYLGALHKQFQIRDFDYSQIGDSKSLSLRNHVSLVNKMVLISLVPYNRE